MIQVKHMTLELNTLFYVKRYVVYMEVFVRSKVSRKQVIMENELGGSHVKPEREK